MISRHPDRVSEHDYVYTVFELMLFSIRILGFICVFYLYVYYSYFIYLVFYPDGVREPAVGLQHYWGLFMLLIFINVYKQ